jgi:hypothetical protein
LLVQPRKGALTLRISSTTCGDSKPLGLDEQGDVAVVVHAELHFKNRGKISTQFYMKLVSQNLLYGLMLETNDWLPIRFIGGKHDMGERS